MKRKHEEMIKFWEYHNKPSCEFITRDMTQWGYILGDPLWGERTNYRFKDELLQKKFEESLLISENFSAWPQWANYKAINNGSSYMFTEKKPNILNGNIIMDNNVGNWEWIDERSFDEIIERQKKEWYENITKPVLCKVEPIYIVSYKNGIFIDESGAAWTGVTPLTNEEIKEFLR